MEKENSKLIHIKLPVELILKLDDEAKREYSNRTAVVKRILLKEYTAN